MTLSFQGAPPGVQIQIGVYTNASGMQFGPLTPQRLYLNGGEIPGYPDNGTCYLENPEGSMRFGFNQLPLTGPSGPLVPFNFLSFDAAEYDSFGPTTLEVVGYEASQLMGPVVMVTNYFAVSSQTFQTFYLDSSFQNVFRVDMLNASFSLDDIVISGIPEPGTGAFVALGAGCGIAWVRRKRKRTLKSKSQ